MPKDPAECAGLIPAPHSGVTCRIDAEDRSGHRHLHCGRIGRLNLKERARLVRCATELIGIVTELHPLPRLESEIGIGSEAGNGDDRAAGGNRRDRRATTEPFSRDHLNVAVTIAAVVDLDAIELVLQTLIAGGGDRLAAAVASGLG